MKCDEMKHMWLLQGPPFDVLYDKYVDLSPFSKRDKVYTMNVA